jgi:chromosome segregation ATPase
MDINNGNEEITIDWEQEAIIYQDALEAALQLQRDLEQTINQLRERFTQQITHTNGTISDLETKILKQEQTLSRQKQEIDRSQKRVQKQKEEISRSQKRVQKQKEEISRLQKRVQEQKEELNQKDSTIAQLQQASKILQKALRKQNEDSTRE